jgi:hypothetical protein
MRGKFLFVVGLALLLGSCSPPKVNQPPPPLNKQLLTGKWISTTEDLLIAGYEFAADGTMKVTVRGLAEPLQARYAWSGDRTLDLEYQASPEVQQAYKTAVKTYKDGVRDRIKSGKLPDRAADSIMSTARDELPASETVHVALAEKPLFLVIENAEGASQTFDKAD